MSRKVIAVDFDDTLFTNSWPGVGEPIWPVINKAKEEQANGAAIILWTCRAGDSLDAAVEACRAVGLIPDAVNETLPEWLATWVDDPRKIGANEYWDDRAVNIKPFIEEEPDRDIVVNGVYRHFKGGEYRVVGTAMHSETGEMMVMYYCRTDIGHGDFKMWARPLNNFLSRVDKKKYPDAVQEYRFELIEE